MDYKLINTISDIRTVMRSNSSADGESIRFELKGAKGRPSRPGITKESKQQLAKTISAFANTYGGALCFHFGEGNNVMPFPSEMVGVIFNKLEAWLRDSIQPRVSGMDVKIVEDVFLINVPESNTKPHRATPDSIYYYRHGATSEKMPEIMISSMYRSQAALDFTLNSDFTRTPRQLILTIWMQNLSNLSGTKPKVHVQIYTSSDFNKKFKFGRSADFLDYSDGAFTGSVLYYKYKFRKLAHLESNADFREKILYPQNTLSLRHFTETDYDIGKIEYFLVRIDCMFKEGLQQTEHKILHFKDSSKANIIMSSNKYNGDDVITQFARLIKSGPFAAS